MKHLCGIIILVLLSGCVSPVVVKHINTECAIHEGVLRQWEGLTPVQQKTAYEKSKIGWFTHRFNVLGIPVDIPASLQLETVNESD